MPEGQGTLHERPQNQVCFICRDVINALLGKTTKGHPVADA
jgi:hypothetical protein